MEIKDLVTSLSMSKGSLWWRLRIVPRSMEATSQGTLVVGPTILTLYHNYHYL